MSESGGLDRAAAGRFARYREYKDSGVEWLGEIPAHWEIRRLKYTIANIVDQTELRPDDRMETDVYVALEHVEGWTGMVRVPLGLGEAPGSQVVVKRFRAGDVLFGKLRPYLAKVTRLSRSGVCVGEFLVLRPRHQGVLTAYMEDLLRSKPIIDTVNSSTFGAKMPRADWQFIGGLRVPHPPIKDQRCIAAFLDRETARIDALVAKQQELIALLQEKRTALISHAVTRGLDTEAAMRDSGVEWLGEIPAHWDVQALKTLSAMRSGDSITSDSIESTGPYPVFGGNGLRGYTGDFTHEGDHVLIGRQGAHCGNVHLARGRFWASEHAVVVTLKGPNLVEWCGALLEAMDLNRLSVAAAQPGLAVERLRDSHVPVPPVVEQREIVGFLDREIAAIAELVSKANDAIDLLNGYRIALISAAVTGRIDVRHHG